MVGIGAPGASLGATLADRLAERLAPPSRRRASLAGGPMPSADARAEGGAPGPPRLPVRRIVAQSAAIWLATRAAFAVLTYFAILLTARDPTTGAVPIGPAAMLKAWDRWDVIWYIDIARKGYWTEQAAAFFPLYPALIRLAAPLVGGHWLLASLLVANLGSLLAFVGVGLFAAAGARSVARSEAAARRTLLVFAAYPLALFTFAGYADGLFIGLAGLALYLARRGSRNAWLGAAACAFLAGATRPTGAILALPLLWEYGRQRGWWAACLRLCRRAWRNRRRPGTLRDIWADVRADVRAGSWRRTLAEVRRRAPTRTALREAAGAAGVVGAAPLAIGLYLAYLRVAFGRPIDLLAVEEKYWFHTEMPPWAAAWRVGAQLFATPAWTYWQAHVLLDVAPVVAFAVITIVAWRRMPFALTLYMLGLLFVAVARPITSGFPDLLMSAGRYMLPAIPAFALLAAWAERRPWLETLLVSGGFMLQGVLVVVFLSGGWLI